MLGSDKDQVHTADYTGPDRRGYTPMQRDWGGHTVFAVVTTVLIVGAMYLVPSLSGWNANATAVGDLQGQQRTIAGQLQTLSIQVDRLQTMVHDLATIQTQVKTDERDIAALQSAQTANNAVLATMGTTLGKITQHLDDLFPVSDGRARVNNR